MSSFAQWRPIFWEPVLGSEERITAGVVMWFRGEWSARRLVRDDTLDALYGSTGNPRELIDRALDMCLHIAQVGGVDALGAGAISVMGLHPGKLRTTEALDHADALRQVVLLHSSLTSI